MREIQILENENSFYFPFGHSELIKAEEESGKWVVYLEASNESLDQDGEITVMKALKDASDHYLTHGVISWDHQHKIMKDPSFIIGEPLDIAFTKHNSTLVKGMLYKENKKAQGAWENILSKSSRLGSSIGGYILKKAVEEDKKVIQQIVWDETAITNKPVNDSTLGRVQILPFTEFAKALMAGTGVNTSQFSGGRTLVGESLQGSLVKPLTLKDLKGWKNMEIDKNLLDFIMKGFLKRIQQGEIKTQQDIKFFVNSYCLKDIITDQLTDFLIDKVNTK